MPPIDSELVRLLMRAGYLAAWKGFHREAVAIFNGVAAVRPESEVPVIGGGVVAMLTGNYDVAVEVLEKALDINPDSALARAHLGGALRLRNDEEEGMKLLREVAAQSADPDAKALATNLLSMEAHQLKPSLSPT
jgi:tetratricopeptide (TPR) repeat protein